MSFAADYHRVHSRLRRQRGPASEHTCPCGAPAAQWAYDRCSDKELRGLNYDGKAVTYTEDLEHYIAMCSACHHALDHPRKEECVHGHALTPQNIYVRPGGGRLCRTCKRESLQRWRAEHPDWRQGVSA